MASQGLLVETDILVEFLTAPAGEPSLLRLLLAEIPCYTTFVQAAELYSCAGTDAEKLMVEPALFGLRVLGASARYAARMGALLRETGGSETVSLREICTAAVAIEANLPIVSQKFLQNYRLMPHTSIIEADVVRQLIRRKALLPYVEALCADKSHKRIS